MAARVDKQEPPLSNGRGSFRLPAAFTSFFTDSRYSGEMVGTEPPPLPSPRAKRWTIARKATVILGVRRGLLRIEQACERYHLTVDEFRSWERDFDAYRAPGLRSTRVGLYRKPPRG